MLMVVSAIGLVLFAGMTVYDAQATRALFAQYAGQGEDMVKKISILRAEPVSRLRQHVPVHSPALRQQGLKIPRAASALTRQTKPDQIMVGLFCRRKTCHRVVAPVQRQETRGMACLVLTAMIWGFAFVSQVQGMASMSPMFFSATRFTLGALSLVPILLWLAGGARIRAIQPGPMSLGPRHPGPSPQMPHRTVHPTSLPSPVPSCNANKPVRPWRDCSLTRWSFP